MTGVRAALLAVCVICCLSGAFTLLAPSGSYGKAVRLSVSLLVLIAIALAIGSIRGIELPDLNDQMGAYESDLSESVQQRLQQNITASIKVQVDEVMRQFEIEVCEVKVDMHISDSGSISLSQVDVGIPAAFAARRQLIKELLDSRLGLYTDVYIMEE